MPSSPYITEMIPAGFSADGNLTFKMTGFFAEVFDNLQVIERNSKDVMADLCCALLIFVGKM
jgi:hypothetical protein